MSKRGDREGLSLAYRVGYRIRYVTLHLFGPAQLGGSADPHRRLERERAARVEAARRARLSGGSPTADRSTGAGGAPGR